MIVYHGSADIIKSPDVKYSKKYLDFGRGFYLTTYENQAKKWALRKGMRLEKSGVVNVYDLKDNWKEYKVLSFEKENEKWLDFVCACRRGEPLNKDYPGYRLFDDEGTKTENKVIIDTEAAKTVKMIF